jgi:SAM-dependent methyltransferase
LSSELSLIARAANVLRKLLAEPETASLDLDGYELTVRRRELIRNRRFLRAIYEEWYADIAANIPQSEEGVLEIGSGGGFIESVIPEAITSDVLPLPGVDVVLDAEWLPFPDRSLRAVVMTNVFHHVPDVSRFLSEFARCTRSGGTLVMIEPWVTRWSRVVYGKIHHEPFDPEASDWRFDPGHPLSEANGALPWIVFVRDRKIFTDRFPTLRVETIRPMMPARYLVSGGVSMRSLSPGWSYPAWKKIDEALGRLSPETAMFALIVVRRI